MAHQEIDLKNPKTNRKNAGFTDEERQCFATMLEAGFVDTFRHFYPDAEGMYSWWSYQLEDQRKERGLAYRLFSGVSCAERTVGRRRNSYGNHGL